MPSRDIRRESVAVEVGGVSLQGELTIPDAATGLVLFAHGSGSSRQSPRNKYVAQVLEDADVATLLFDLLTIEEERVDVRTRHLRFDIELLAERVVGAIDWARVQDATRDMRIGLFGASTGAAAALVAAAARPQQVAAVVSRGGRPDLADDALGRVQAPTLLLVGSLDTPVIGMNQAAQRRMRAPNRLELVQGASHLFEERGTLELVASKAATFFRTHLGRPAELHPGVAG